MDIKIKKELIEYFSEYVTENKKIKIEDILLKRTRYVTIVLEDIFQTHNASAVVRSAECFGIQDIHIIEKRNKFSPTNSIAKGSAKWMNIHKYKTTQTCIESLKKNGYKIVATVPHTPNKKPINLHKLDINKKIAFLFGTEALGLSQEAIDLSDEFITIPMFGFTESFNISVSVAICLYDITSRLRKSHINWGLTEEEIINTKLNWFRNAISSSEFLEKKFFKLKNS